MSNELEDSRMEHELCGGCAVLLGMIGLLVLWRMFGTLMGVGCVRGRRLFRSS